MDKRYQVFISSTYADLKEERSRVIQTVMELDCIPAGMEMFPAADEEQLTFIKRVIDDCDYYIVIVGGRYGSTTAEGVSFTEREYEYALERGLKVIALLHQDPKSLPVSKSEEDSVARERLERFRSRLSEGRLVKFWSSAEALPGMVALSLAKTIKLFPAQGWVRASAEPREELLAEIAELRRKNEALAGQVNELRAAQLPDLSDLATLDEQVALAGQYSVGSGSNRRELQWNVRVTWRELFSDLAPSLMDGLAEQSVRHRMTELLFSRSENTRGNYPKLDDRAFHTVKLQLMALELVQAAQGKSTDGTYHVFWNLTSAGRNLMFESRVQRTGAERAHGSAEG